MNMPQSTPITNREELQKYLQVALQVEHATIPPYLTALYSIQADPVNNNLDSYNIIRAVVVEEMLHLTLAANLLNAIGGAPDLTRKGFVPDYPAYLPTGESDFRVSLEKFSESAIDTFLEIERPDCPTKGKPVVKKNDVWYVKHADMSTGRKTGRGLLPSFVMKGSEGNDLHLHFWSIGDFYKAIRNGFSHLAEKMGEKELFNGKEEYQVGPEYYHSSGGKITKVTNLATALEAIDLISGQGEGSFGQIYDDEGELSHYYRFHQIKKRRYYRLKDDKKVPKEPGDKPDHPTGPEFKVNWDEVFPIKRDAKVSQFPAGSEIREAALTFNREYKNFLAQINRALNGKPSLLGPSFAGMFKIKEAVKRLIHNPLPTGKENAAPTFEIDEVAT